MEICYQVLLLFFCLLSIITGCFQDGFWFLRTVSFLYSMNHDFFNFFFSVSRLLNLLFKRFKHCESSKCKWLQNERIFFYVYVLRSFKQVSWFNKYSLWFHIIYFMLLWHLFDTLLWLFRDYYLRSCGNFKQNFSQKNAANTMKSIFWLVMFFTINHWRILKAFASHYFIDWQEEIINMTFVTHIFAL